MTHKALIFLLLSSSLIAFADECKIVQRTIVPRGISVTLNGKTIRKFKALLTEVDAHLEFYANSIFSSENTLLRSLDYINQLKSEERCKTKPLKCEINILSGAVLHTRLLQYSYSIELSESDSSRDSETIFTYASNLDELKIAIDALTESGICEKHEILPSCELETRTHSGEDGGTYYALKINGKAVDTFEFRYFGEKIMQEARDVGICR